MSEQVKQVKAVQGKIVVAAREQVGPILTAYTTAKDSELAWKKYGDAQREQLLAVAGDAEMVVDENGAKLFRAPSVDRRNLSVDDAVDAVKRALAADPSLAATVAAAVERVVNVSTSRRIYK